MEVVVEEQSQKSVEQIAGPTEQKEALSDVPRDLTDDDDYRENFGDEETSQISSIIPE